MKVALTKTMHTYVVGQPKKKSKAQTRRVDGYIYSFASDLSADNYDFEVAYDLIEIFICNIICSSLEKCKDLEISVDIATGHYTFRFWCKKNIGTERDWLLRVTWDVAYGDEANGYEMWETEDYPTDDDTIAAGITMNAVSLKID
jgi:hypothetical protein